MNKIIKLMNTQILQHGHASSIGQHGMAVMICVMTSIVKVPVYSGKYTIYLLVSMLW
jgi:hypothetical protein